MPCTKKLSRNNFGCFGREIEGLILLGPIIRHFYHWQYGLTASAQGGNKVRDCSLTCRERQDRGSSGVKMVTAGSWLCRDTAGGLLRGEESICSLSFERQPPAGMWLFASAPVFEWVQNQGGQGSAQFCHSPPHLPQIFLPLAGAAEGLAG